MLHHKNTKPFFFLITFSTIVFSAKAQFTSLVKKTEQAVFDIKAYDEFGIIDAEGTGFFIDNKGTGITALHVLDDAKYAFIKNQKGEFKRITKITRVCEECDMVEFTTAGLSTPTPFIPAAKSMPAKGSPLFVIGSPDGLTNTVSTGILSAIRVKDSIKTIQTTTPISHGSSGSPLMNAAGEALGVIAYGSTSGQNLNFAYAMDCRKKMQKASGYVLEDYLDKDIRIVNEICKTEPFLILRSMELNDSLTVLNFSYANISIAFGDGAFIYENVKDTAEAMYLTDRSTGEKHYILSSTLGETPETAETMRIGEAVLFSMYFPHIDHLQSFDLHEGMKGGDWTFTNVIVPPKSAFNIHDVQQFSDSSFEDLIGNIHRKRYADAMDDIRSLSKNGKENARLRMAAAVTAYAQDDLDGALVNTRLALKYDPTLDRLHADLSTIYNDQHEYKLALSEINKAIAMNNEYIEYYWMRANILYAQEKWTEAIADFNKYIQSGRNAGPILYYELAMSKFSVGDDTACADLEKAMDLAESDREWDKYSKEKRKKCK